MLTLKHAHVGLNLLRPSHGNTETHPGENMFKTSVHGYMIYVRCIYIYICILYTIYIYRSFPEKFPGGFRMDREVTFRTAFQTNSTWGNGFSVSSYCQGTPSPQTRTPKFCLQGYLRWVSCAGLLPPHPTHSAVRAPDRVKSAR